MAEVGRLSRFRGPARRESEIVLGTSEPLAPAAIFRVVCSILEALLFERSQLPTAVKLIKREAAALEHSSRLRRSRGERERASFLQHLQSVRDALELAFVNLSVRRVLLLLGATTVSAREVFEIDVSPIGLTPECLLDEKDIDRLCTRVLISLLSGNVSWAEGLRQRPGLMRAHVCILASGDPPDDLPLRPARAFHIPRTATSVSFTLSPHEGVSSSAGSCSKPPSSTCLPELMERVTLTESSANSEGMANGDRHTSGLSAERDASASIMWYQIPVVLKGFRSNH